MNKLINREEVLKELERLANNQVDYKIANGIYAAINVIEKAPAAVIKSEQERWRNGEC